MSDEHRDLASKQSIGIRSAAYAGRVYPPPENHLRATVMIEARHLDTDDRSRVTLGVERPRSDSEARRQLAELTAEIHPRARLRSFAHGAATFLDRDYLIVAFYVDSQGQPLRTPCEPMADSAQESAPAQSTLFF